MRLATKEEAALYIVSHAPFELEKAGYVTARALRRHSELQRLQEPKGRTGLAGVRRELRVAGLARCWPQEEAQAGVIRLGAAACRYPAGPDGSTRWGELQPPAGLPQADHFARIAVLPPVPYPGRRGAPGFPVSRDPARSGASIWPSTGGATDDKISAVACRNPSGPASRCAIARPLRRHRRIALAIMPVIGGH